MLLPLLLAPYILQSPEEIVQVVEMLVQMGEWQRVVVVIADLVTLGLQPNESIYRSMITACGHLAQW